VRREEVRGRRCEEEEEGKRRIVRMKRYS